MRVFNVIIPDEEPLTNYDIWRYVRKIRIPYFKRVCMLNELPKAAKFRECSIVNLNKTGEKGSHWVAYWKKGKKRIYFDSFGQVTPIEIQKYLKTPEEFKNGKNVIQRNTDIVQSISSSICGHLCIYILKALSERWAYGEILAKLRERKLIFTN